LIFARYKGEKRGEDEDSPAAPHPHIADVIYRATSTDLNIFNILIDVLLNPFINIARATWLILSS
jgi:hypothetical protein